ncbi:SMAD/FHA domain-containing protein [Trametes gibbosa]|nr:SMAD/FHA domain-containing protein [Trametes gibbosa]
MPRESSRPSYGERGNDGGSSRAHRDRYREDDRNDYRQSRRDAPGPRRADADEDRRRPDGGGYGHGYDRNHNRDREPDRYGDRDRERERERERERGHGRGRERDDDDRDRAPRRPGPSRRSASPRPRAPEPEPRSRSGSEAAEDKTKPNFAPSGLLAAETKTVRHADGTGTVLKYHEPPEARKPSVGWRLYVFKGKEQVDLLHIQRQSAYLVGRDRAVVDIAVEHPSCSKQHAVIQYRQVREKNEFGDVKTAVKPFIIDLESTNGTIVNDKPVPTSRYYELMPGDVIKFGESAREYVLLSEDAA